MGAGTLMKRKRKEAARLENAPRPSWGVVVVGCVTAFAAVGGQVSRWFDARRNGDVELADSLGREMAIGFPVSAAAVAAIVLGLILLPTVHLLRTRRLARRFPGSRLFTAVSPDAADELRGTLMPVDQRSRTFGLTIVADEHGISFWRGVLRYRVCGAASWGFIDSVCVEEGARNYVLGYVLVLESAAWPASFKTYLMSSPWGLRRPGRWEETDAAAQALKRLWQESRVGGNGCE